MASNIISEIAVLFVPFAAHSHFNQLFELSQIISSYNNDNNNAISVHVIGSTFHNARVKSCALHAPSPNCTVQFHDIPNMAPLPQLHAQSPTDTHEALIPTNPSIPLHLHEYSAAYVEYLRPHVARLLSSLAACSRRVVVVHDTLTSSAVQDVVSLPNAESYVFHSVSTVSCLSLLLSGMGEEMEGGIPSAEGCFSPEIGDFVVSQYEHIMSNGTSGKLQNTSRVMESDFVDLLVKKEREVLDQILKLWTIGPLQRLKMVKVNAKPPSSVKHGKRNSCLEWLDKQDRNSVLYVCFGTLTVVEEGQLRELAIGLERSGTKFIWVLINPEDFYEVSRGGRASSVSKLPLGFEERVRESGTGMVVREWAPQLEILGHPSTGGFLSHCGWNSCLESLSLGVPLLTWPMHSDQPMNAALVTDIVKAGMPGREWAKRNEVVSSSEIAEVVKRLMNSEEGGLVKKRAEELGVELRKSTREGGVARLELESFVAHITR